MADRIGSVGTLGMYHYAVAVSDLDRAIGWYGRMLGFEVERHFGFLELGTEIAHVVDPNGVRIPRSWRRSSGTAVWRNARPRT